MNKGLTKNCITTLISVFIVWAVSFPAHSAAPRQDIVLLIDSSGSMGGGGNKGSDPQGLRGVAANFILDAAELISDLKCAVIFFDDRVSGDTTLKIPAKIRHKLKAENLPPAQHTSNMEDGLRVSIGAVSASAAPKKKVVVITDGVPVAQGNKRDEKQVATIINELVPRAKDNGIEIFALGFGNQIDKDFLDKVCNPTGGRAITAKDAIELVVKAKELLGETEGVSMIKNESLQPGIDQKELHVPDGVDRARLTVSMKNPNIFRQGQLDFVLQGPGAEYQTVDGMIYTAIKDDISYIGCSNFITNSWAI